MGVLGTSSLLIVSSLHLERPVLTSLSLLAIQEEHPPLMSSFAMGSVLVNYYRKKDETDEYIPRVSLLSPFYFYLRLEPSYLTVLFLSLVVLSLIFSSARPRRTLCPRIDRRAALQYLRSHRSWSNPTYSLQQPHQSSSLPSLSDPYRFPRRQVSFQSGVAS